MALNPQGTRLPVSAGFEGTLAFSTLTPERAALSNQGRRAGISCGSAIGRQTGITYGVGAPELVKALQRGFR